MSVTADETRKQARLDEVAAQLDCKNDTRETVEHELTDAGNAERFNNQSGDDVRYVPEWGWMVWTGTHWARDKLRVRKLVQEMARAIHNEAANQTDTKVQDAIGKWARNSQQANRLQGAMWCAEPMLAANVDDFDREPMMLPVANGTLDLSTGELHPHRREYMATRIAPVYFDKSATCPAWLKFLDRVLPDGETQSFLQRMAGYSLTGRTTDQVLVFLYGHGRNGKSVFIETVAALLGDYHRATRIETLSIGKGGIPNDVAALAGARLVTVSETPEGSRLNESLVKDLTGGDTISARFLNREFFDFKPQFKLWIRGNHKPQIRGTDDGIWRRMMLVPFTVQIPPDEVDSDLSGKLRDELPGILSWALQGCLQWQHDGLRPPDTITDAVREYRVEMDLLGEFIEDRCIQHQSAKAKASDLYAAYQRWCDDSGHQSVSSTRFGLTLGERGFRKVKSGTVSWIGIGLAAADYEAAKWGESEFNGRAC